MRTGRVGGEGGRVGGKRVFIGSRDRQRPQTTRPGISREVTSVSAQTRPRGTRGDRELRRAARNYARRFNKAKTVLGRDLVSRRKRLFRKNKMKTRRRERGPNRRQTVMRLRSAVVHFCLIKKKKKNDRNLDTCSVLSDFNRVKYH